MEILLKAAAIAVAGCILGIAVRKNNPEAALMLALAVLCLLVYLCAGILEEITAFLRELAQLSGLNTGSVAIVLKTVAISIVSRIAAAICRDAQQQAAATGVELAACCCALYAAIPLFRAAMEMALSFC